MNYPEDKVAHLYLDRQISEPFGAFERRYDAKNASGLLVWPGLAL
jgi:hypothetical protein